MPASLSRFSVYLPDAPTIFAYWLKKLVEKLWKKLVHPKRFRSMCVWRSQWKNVLSTVEENWEPSIGLGPGVRTGAPVSCEACGARS